MRITMLGLRFTRTKTTAVIGEIAKSERDATVVNLKICPFIRR